MFKKLMLPTIIVLFVAANASSVPDGAGQYAFPFLLSTPVGAKQTALGGAWCGWAKGPESFFSNVASPVLAKGKSAAVGFENYWGLFNSGYAIYNHPLSEDAAFSGSVRLVSYGEFIGMDESGNSTDNFTGSDFAITGGYSRKFSRNIAAGIAAKVVYSGIDTFSASALSFDLGAIYRDRRDDFRIGLAVSNLGTMLSHYSDSEPSLPWSAKLGGFYHLPGFPGEVGAQIETAADVPIRLRAGLELDFLKPFFLRVGYTTRTKPDNDLADTEGLSGLSGGFGIDYKKLSLNYSMQHFGSLDIVHSVGIGYVGF